MFNWSNKCLILSSLVLALFAACSTVPRAKDDTGWVPKFSGERNSLYRIKQLKASLAKAQHDRIVAVERAQRLDRRLIKAYMIFIRNRAQRELTRIRGMRVASSHFKRYQEQDLSKFYLKEREILVKIIEEEEEEMKIEAQKTLDHILEMITKLNEKLDM